MGQDEIIELLKKHPEGLIAKEIDNLLTNISISAINHNIKGLIKYGMLEYTLVPNGSIKGGPEARRFSIKKKCHIKRSFT